MSIRHPPTFAAKPPKLPAVSDGEAPDEALDARVVGGVSLTMLLPVPAAWWRERRAPGSLVATLAPIHPPFPRLDAVPRLGRRMRARMSARALVRAVLAVPPSGDHGPFGAMIAGLSPADGRATALSCARNVAVGRFGGCGRIIATRLIRTTGTPLAPTDHGMTASRRH